jgi:hypothetical protein
LSLLSSRAYKTNQNTVIVKQKSLNYYSISWKNYHPEPYLILIPIYTELIKNGASTEDTWLQIKRKRKEKRKQFLAVPKIH